MSRIEKTMILMAYGFWGYPFLEILFRGWSHWSMALAGGLCFGLMGLVSDTLYRYRLPVRAMASAVTVLFVEFIFGCIFNLGMQLHIWDYSRELGNLAGQICIKYGLLWFVLSIPLVWLADRLPVDTSCKQRKIGI